MRTLGSVLYKHRGIGPGFDTLRLSLSVTILCFHSVRVSYGIEGELRGGMLLGSIITALLPTFFGLSGFLVMGSAARNPDLIRFISLRGLRIVPALFTEIVASALVLGALVTSLSLDSYFTHPDFIRYFGSLIGKVSTRLPGVFDTNPDPDFVNCSLWTIGPELLCYVYLSIIILLQWQSRRSLMTTVVIFITLANLLADTFLGHFLSSSGIANPRLLINCFAIGNLIYMWKEKIPFNHVMFSLCLLVGILGIKVPGLVYVSGACLTYCIAFLGLCKLPRPSFMFRGDYSYGIYLYAYPIQQTITYLLPEYRSWYINIAISLPITILLAVLSWHYVESPALSLRSKIPNLLSTKKSWLSQFLILSALLSYGSFLIRDYGLPWHRLGLTYAFIIPTVVLFGGIVYALSAILLRSSKVDACRQEASQE